MATMPPEMWATDDINKKITSAMMLAPDMLAVDWKPATQLVTRKCQACGVRYFSLAGGFDWRCSDCRPDQKPQDHVITVARRIARK